MSQNRNGCYLPQPPRAWSRVQNSCTYDLNNDENNNNNNLNTIFFTQMLNKGNVLQYKANSSNLTLKQKYSKIAKGQWVNRNTTWATQSTRGYTNPNTTSLKRSGNKINIAIDPNTGLIIGETSLSPTCPELLPTINSGLPAIIDNGATNDPIIPPPVEPTPSSETFPEIIPDSIEEPIVIQDGGVLICSIQENICTGDGKSSVAQQLCYPTTDSDVPGTIQDLCWNNGTQTWYPRQRYIMTNSGNKWPTNYKEFNSAVKPPSVILTANIQTCSVILTWSPQINDISLSCNCLPITSYNIYLNGLLYRTVPASVNSIELNSLNPGIGVYEAYVESINSSSNIPYNSVPSNVISVYINSNITILGYSNIKYTRFSDGIYNGVIIENTMIPNFNGGGYGEATIMLCNAFTLYGILVGGGGGGASGYGLTGKVKNSGAGGGGGSIIYFDNYVPPTNQEINIKIGSGGGGRTPGNLGAGNSSGQSGFESSIIQSNGYLLANPGLLGQGVGDATTSGGGNGGDAIENGSIATNILGYGGGGGGGAFGGNVNSQIPGTGGLGSGSNGSPGTSGNADVPGNGGNSGIVSYTIPGLGTLKFGGGGGGGSLLNGGSAGNGIGGLGGTNTFISGANASNYGGGGGGGASSLNNNSNIGGNGGNGVLILWWLI